MLYLYLEKKKHIEMFQLWKCYTLLSCLLLSSVSLHAKEHPLVGLRNSSGGKNGGTLETAGS